MFAYDENKERRHQEKVCCRGLRSGKQLTNTEGGCSFRLVNPFGHCAR